MQTVLRIPFNRDYFANARQPTRKQKIKHLEPCFFVVYNTHTGFKMLTHVCVVLYCNGLKSLLLQEAAPADHAFSDEETRTANTVAGRAGQTEGRGQAAQEAG